MKGLFIFFVLTGFLFAQEKTLTVSAEAFRVEPKKVSFNESLINTLNIPDGFSVDVFAKDLENPRMIAVNENGDVYVTCPKAKNVILLKSNDMKGTEKIIAAENLKDVHGIAIKEDKIFLCTPTELYKGTIQNDGKIGELEKIVDDLPDGGQHPNRTIAFGPGNKLFISVGSTCNACEETNKEHASIIVMNEDGTERKVFAKGLRNTIGFDWHPVTGELWGMDHGSDFRGNDIPPEELNKLEEGNDYGWPFCYGEKEIDEMTGMPKDGTSPKDYCAKTTGAVLTYQSHSAPIEMIFYRGNSFPLEFRGDAFVAMRGSWNRETPTGYKVVRISFDDNGTPTAFEDFISGFLDVSKNEQFGRLAGLAEHPDGSLLLSDDTNGVIYKISYNTITYNK